MTSLIDSLLLRFGYGKIPKTPPVDPVALRTQSPQQYCDMLLRYYANSDLYMHPEVYYRALFMGDTIRGYRNPANRAVEFYAATVCSGDLFEDIPIQASKDTLVDAIHDLWKWSNWTVTRFMSVRHLALFGDTFIKVAQKEDGRPFLQVLQPREVIVLEEDHRGFITRIEIESYVGEKGNLRKRTEVWTLDSLTVTVGSEEPVVTALSEMGIDFIPIVHAKFRDVGSDSNFGVGCFVHCLDKIDELNRREHRLGTTAFRNARTIWALLANGTDREGRPLPAVSVKNLIDNTDTGSSEKDTMIRLPGHTDIKSLVPALPYDAFADIVQLGLQDLEQDLPEMRFWRVVEGNETGRAVEKKLMPALSRAREVRSLWEAALVKAHMMAFTLGTLHGVWTDLGTFENGDFKHSFRPRPYLPTTIQERGEDETAVWSAVSVAVNVGAPLDVVLRRLGFSDHDISLVAASVQKKQKEDKVINDAAEASATDASAPPSNTGLTQK